MRSRPGAEKGGQGESGGDTCAPELGGEASGWLRENKIKAVPGGGNKEGREEKVAQLAAGCGEAALVLPAGWWVGDVPSEWHDLEGSRRDPRQLRT